MTVKEICQETYYWCSIIIPPCCILPLAAIPFDLPTGFLWAIACIFGLGSSFSVMIAILVYFFNLLGIKIKHDNQKRKTQIIRPLLTLCFLSFAFFSITTSLEAAKRFAKAKAIEIQKICKTGKCPELIEGWTDRGKNDLYRSQTMEGDIAKYAVRYKVFNDFKEFEIYVRVDIDISHVIATGGTEKELIFTKK